jgi:hypothetical protein
VAAVQAVVADIAHTLAAVDKVAVELLHKEVMVEHGMLDEMVEAHLATTVLVLNHQLLELVLLTHTVVAVQAVLDTADTAEPTVTVTKVVAAALVVIELLLEHQDVALLQNRR